MPEASPLSPSLLALITLSLEKGPSPKFEGRTLRQQVQALAESSQSEEALIPIVARTSSPSFIERFSPLRRQNEKSFFTHDSGASFWGRYRIEEILSLALELGDWDEQSVYIDCGAPVLASAWSGGTPPRLESLAAKLAGPNVAEACLAIIDRGELKAGGAPETYGGKVTQLTQNGVVCGEHANQVLFAALERLQHQGILQRTHVVMELVAPPKSNVGLSCFDHANSPELLSSTRRMLAELNSQARWQAVPWMLNLSLGTHCGAHIGESPLEVAFRASTTNERGFTHVAAGNDGEKRIHASVAVSSMITEYLDFHCGPCSTTELLIEFWWDSDHNAELEVEVTVPQRAAITGLPINRQGQQQLVFRGTNTLRACAYAGRVHGTMSCISFALQTPTASDMSALSIQFVLRATEDITVHAWAVVTPGDTAAFDPADKASTLRVPATVNDVFAVAGVDGALQPWRDSSQGPLPLYLLGGGARGSYTAHPTLAHQVEMVWNAKGTPGTSFAAPRSAVDALAVVLNHPPTDPPLTLDAIRTSVIGQPLQHPHPRVGYGAAKL